MTIGADRQARYRARRRAQGLCVVVDNAARADRRRRYKATPGGKAATAAARRRAVDRRPFVGVDGEGSGSDEHGRQHYMLLRAGDAELFTGSPLRTLECLEFLALLPPEPIMVGFSFGYDVTQILRDLPGERREKLLSDKAAGKGRSRYTWFGMFGIEYLPRNYFRVCRLARRGDKLYQVPGTARTIYETWGFFQGTFLKAIDAWDIGTIGERETIERNKAERGDVAIGDEQRRYCALECRFLAELMEKFRGVCLDVGMRPKTWNGAGKLASVLHRQHGTLDRETLGEIVPAEVLALASAAYYGGRFEVTRTGAINEPVHAYDIRSAYPAAMVGLPCLVHGIWEAVTGDQLAALAVDDPGRLYVAALRFNHRKPVDGRMSLCGLPVRLKTGRICWPRQARGVYWSTEINAAAKLGCEVVHESGWVYTKACDCRPFDWVGDLYKYRRTLPTLQGFSLRLAINSLYGKLAQRVGNPQWGNAVWASLITATARAWLIEAAAADPQSVVMLATDALFTLRPLASIAVGTELGQWEHVIHDRLFIVQPGVYWGPPKPKTRGVSPAFFTAPLKQAADFIGPPITPMMLFQVQWKAYAEHDQAAHRGGRIEVPMVALPLKLFIGLKLAQARGKPLTAGQWVEQMRRFSFKWTGKRDYFATWEVAWRDHPMSPRPCTRVWSYPMAGGADLVSLPHKGGDPDLLESLAAADLERGELDDQPDAVEFID